MRVRPTYTDEFKADAVEALRRSDRSAPQVAADLGITAQSLRNWYRKDEMAKKGKGSSKSKAPSVAAEETAEQRLARLERENTALRKENESLRMDREILKNRHGRRPTSWTRNSLRLLAASGPEGAAGCFLVFSNPRKNMVQRALRT